MLEAIQKALEAPSEDRLGMPLTYVVGPDGERHVLSRYGDDRIDMSPYMKNPAQSQRHIDMTLFPERWRSSVTDLLMAFWRYGRPGRAAPKASTVLNKAVLLTPLVRWLHKKKVAGFSSVRPLHLTAFVEEYAAADEQGNARKAGTIAGILGTVNLAWELRARMSDGMKVHPLGNRGSVGKLAKLIGKRSSKLVTEALTEADAAALFKACEEALVDIEDTLLDYEEIEAYKDQNPVGANSKYCDRDVYWSMPHLHGQWQTTERRIHDARAACFTLIGLLVGPRISEILLLESGCYSERQVQGDIVGWMRGKTLKMRPDGAEATEWIAPPRVGELVAIMTRIAAPLRARLLLELESMEAELQAPRLTQKRRLFLIKHIREGRRSLDRLFLSAVRNQKKQGGGVLKGAGRHGAVPWMQRMVKMAGLKISVHPHMLRRTYAAMVVLSCAGDLRYLRKQFQHWSIETTQLYASHEAREQELMDEIGDEMLKQKVDMVSNWLSNNTLLSGQGGEHIKAEREKPEFRGLMEADLRTVANHLSEGLVIRATGHAWCVSTPVPSCGGQGLYDATHCARCDSAVVTEDKRSVWELLAQQMLEVQSLDDTGVVGRQVARQSLEAYDAILAPLGSSVAQVARAMEAES